MSVIIFGNQTDLQGVHTPTTHVEEENPTSDFPEQSRKSCWNNICVQLGICLLIILFLAYLCSISEVFETGLYYVVYPTIGVICIVAIACAKDKSGSQDSNTEEEE